MPPEADRRRATDRHYVAVFAAEARRLARQLRAPGGGRAGGNRTTVEQEQPEVSH
jgi:hypothetical protein